MRHNFVTWFIKFDYTKHKIISYNGSPEITERYDIGYSVYHDSRKRSVLRIPRNDSYVNVIREKLGEVFMECSCTVVDIGMQRFISLLLTLWLLVITKEITRRLRIRSSRISRTGAAQSGVFSQHYQSIKRSQPSRDER